MKNLMTLIALVISTSVFANTNPEITEVNTESLSFISTSEYDEVSEMFTFSTTKNISVVQIFDTNGTLQFQLPVMSDKVMINKNLFDTGVSKLGFVIEGQTEVQITEIRIK